jgi:UDP-N-acetylglucosamine 2-epimerase (non-hydrolysing)
MSGYFFEKLRIPEPNVNHEVGSGTQVGQTARIKERYEALLLKEMADWVLVVGEIPSTMACSIAQKISVLVLFMLREAFVLTILACPKRSTVW